MKTSEAIKAASLGVQELVLLKYGYEITGNRHIECPFCNSKKSFRVNLFNGSYAGICKCGSYPLLELAKHRSGKDGKAFLDEIDELIGNRPNLAPRTEQTTPESIALAQLHDGQPLKGTIAQEYLAKRGINYLPVNDCRFLPNQPYRDSTGQVVGHYDAILMVLTNALGKVVQKHITYLDGPQKAAVESPRKIQTVSNLGVSIAAKIYQTGDVMAVGEGLESCLSYAQIRRVRTLPTLNTNNLKKYRCPDYVKTLYIAADNDHNGAGQAAAYECAHRNILQRPNLEQVIIHMPAVAGYDFNDALLNGVQTMEFPPICRKPS